MEYFVADKFKNYERIGEPFDKNGKLYAKGKTICPRCGGQGIIVARVENGRPIPIPVDQGICYQCCGEKYVYDEFRLYTEKEYNQMQKAKETAAAKREEAREQKMKAECEDNKVKWLEQNNFSEDGITYIVTGDSYSIKDELKEAGWRYDTVLRWHKADPAGYEDRVIKINFDDIFEWTAWGKGVYKVGAPDLIEKMLRAVEPESTSEYLEGTKVKDLEVTLDRRNAFNGRYGLTYVYNFSTIEGNVCTWFTSKMLDIETGGKCLISGSIKDRQEYKGTKSTILTRCKVKEVSE